MVIGGQTFEVNQSTLAGGTNPIRKTADDQKVEEMAEEALDGLDDIEGLDEAVEEAVAVIETEEAQATEEAKRLKKKNWAESFYEPKMPEPILVKKPPAITSEYQLSSNTTRPDQETGYMQVKYTNESQPYLKQVYSENLTNNFGGQ